MLETVDRAQHAIKQLHKFGGSSLADAAGYQRVATIIHHDCHPGDLIVVSAAGSTTNQLLNWLQTVHSGNSGAQQQLHALQHYQQTLITALLPTNQADTLQHLLQRDISHLAHVARSALTEAQRAEILGQGEIWSARLLAALLQQRQLDASWVDARTFLCAERSSQPQVNEVLSRQRLQTLLPRYCAKYLVITGFIAANRAGETVLLGRNGSDYSATQIGALAAVDRVVIWSDVAGVYSADPRCVPDACLLPLLRLDEANELARLAAPVLHARTLQPISASNIDLQLRSSYQPETGATQIERLLAAGSGARIVTGHNEVCLIEIQLAEHQDVASQRRDIEQRLTRLQWRPLAVGACNDKQRLQLCYTAETVTEVFTWLQQTEHGHCLHLRQGLSLLAMVGAGVTRNALHCHRFWQQLTDQAVEFVWSSADNISLVAILRSGSLNHLMQGLHSALFRAEKRVGLLLLGKGNIGARWLTLFARDRQTLSARSGFEFILAGVVDSKRCMLDYQGLEANHVLALFNSQAQPRDESSLSTWMCHHPFDDLVIIDSTASAAVAQQYLQFAQQGFHVISASKIAGAAASTQWRRVRDAFGKTGRHWLYNATVGGGLPINYAVRDLRDSGDTILSVSGIFSGTLSWLFIHYNGSVAFTELVKQAWQQGLTEPDPRLDLSGQDSMRKLVILIREAGYDIEPQRVRVESLVSAVDEQVALETFLQPTNPINQVIQQRYAAAQELGLTLHYVARFDLQGRARVGIEAIARDHPLASLLPGDNVFAIESRWYRDHPLVIRGPGAGRDVTAGAIQSDINRLAQLL